MIWGHHFAQLALFPGQTEQKKFKIAQPSSRADGTPCKLSTTHRPRATRGRPRQHPEGRAFRCLHEALRRVPQDAAAGEARRTGISGWVSQRFVILGTLSYKGRLKEGIDEFKSILKVPNGDKCE